jgi:glycosidase
MLGCLKPLPVIRLSRPTPIAVAYLRDDALKNLIYDVPQNLPELVGKQLATRNLVQQVVPLTRFKAAFDRLRDSGRRQDYLTRLAGDGDALVLVETKVLFYSQLSGRYKWTVHVKLAIRDLAKPETSIVRELEAPAFMTFDHEREAEALASVAGVVAKGVASLVDAYYSDKRAAQQAEREVAPPPSAPTGPTVPPAIGPVPGKGRKSQPRSPSPESSAVWSPESIYFILVDRFHNGEKKNDGVIDRLDPIAWHGGDLAGVIQKLNYLQQLGVRTLWLSPLFRSRAAPVRGHGAFHGYWVEDLNQIDPRFGTASELRRLVDEAKRRRMGVVLDLVVNHVAYESPLLRTKPHWFHWRGDVRDWNDREQVETHDVHGLPDLNQDQPEVYAYLKGAALRWIAESGAAGYRLDAVKHVPVRFWRKLNSDLTRAVPQIILLAEHFHGSPTEVRRVRDEGHFTHMFDFPLAFALRDVFCGAQSVARIGSILAQDGAYHDPSRLVTFLDNHDLPRIRSACGDDLGRVRQALTALFALRGIPALTYGTEVGLRGAKEPENRGDMIFDHGIEGQAKNLREHVRQLLQLRRRHAVLAQGESWLESYDGHVLVIGRSRGDQLLFVALSSSSEGRRIRFAADMPRARFHDLLGAKQTSGEALQVAPRSVRILLASKASARGVRPFVQRRTAGLRRVIRLRLSGLGAGPRALTLKAVGSASQLGHWDPRASRAVFREVAGPGRAVLELLVPRGTLIAYKLVRWSDSEAPTWEPGDDRYLFVGWGKGPLLVDLGAWRS